MGGILKKEGKRSVSFRDERVPKKACTENFSDMCKKHGGAHATHNTGDCKKYEKDGNLKAGFQPKKAKSNRNENFAQVMKDSFAKVTKAFKKELKKTSQKKKNCKRDSSNSDSS